MQPINSVNLTSSEGVATIISVDATSNKANERNKRCLKESCHKSIAKRFRCFDGSRECRRTAMIAKHQARALKREAKLAACGVSIDPEYRQAIFAAKLQSRQMILEAKAIKRATIEEARDNTDIAAGRQQIYEAKQRFKTACIDAKAVILAASGLTPMQVAAVREAKKNAKIARLQAKLEALKNIGALKNDSLVLDHTTPVYNETEKLLSQKAVKAELKAATKLEKEKIKVKKAALRAEKKALKLAKKQSKSARKVHRPTDAEMVGSPSKLSKEERKQQKAEKKLIKEKKIHDLENARIESLPVNGNILVDGNNIMPCDSTLRSKLRNGARAARPGLLVMINKFAERHPEFALSCIFDRNGEDRIEGRVTVMHSFDKIADDVIVERLTAQRNEGHADQLPVVVTSDRELTLRLFAIGVRVMKSGRFYRFMTEDGTTTDS